MNMQTKTHSTTYRHLLSLGLATSATLGIMATLPSKATALSLTNGTLTNTNADGNVQATSRKVILTGGDNGSNLSGTTDWTILIDSAMAGDISFNWSYFTLDTPGFDSAGFLLNGQYTPLAVQDGDSSTSPISLTLKNGDIFGFRVQTSTNTDGAGELTIYESVPEPSTILGTIITLGFGKVFKRRLAKANKKKSDS
jgi:hypothetical protein